MKQMKKVISIILCAFMLFGTFAIAACAVDSESDHLPQIYVSGIGSRKVYYADDPEKKSLFYPIDMDKFMGNIENMPGYAKDSVKNLDPDIVYNCLYNWAYETFGDSALQPDGFTSKPGVVIDDCPLSYEESRDRYVFNYDSRLDPVDLARQLDEYIGWVQEDTGSKRVELVGSSYGSSIIMAYLNEYKEKSAEIIDSAILCVPSTGGVDLVGELFTGHATINPDTLEQFVNVSLGNEDLDLLLSVMNKSGTLDFLILAMLDSLIRIAVMDALTDIVHDVVGTMPSMWTFVQDEYFYKALKHVYGKNYDSPDHEYAVLIEKITYYHENIMNRSTEILQSSQKAGINVNVICKYGRPAVPLSEHGNFRSDGAVSVTASSFGAVASMRDEYLPDDYQQVNYYPEHNLVSPDRCIDASTCALPFNTWFIKGLEHSEKPEAYHEMINNILYNDYDIYSDERYPQFLQTSPETNDILIPTVPEEPVKKPSFFSEYIRLIKRIFELFKEKIRSLFTFKK